MAAVTLFVIEATFVGEVLTMDEIREHAELITGRELSLKNIQKLKERGLERLAAAFTERGLQPPGRTE